MTGFTIMFVLISTMLALAAMIVLFSMGSLWIVSPWPDPKLVHGIVAIGTDCLLSIVFSLLAIAVKRNA